MPKGEKRPAETGLKVTCGDANAALSPLVNSLQVHHFQLVLGEGLFAIPLAAMFAGIMGGFSGELTYRAGSGG